MLNISIYNTDTKLIVKNNETGVAAELTLDLLELEEVLKLTNDAITIFYNDFKKESE